MSKKNNRSPLKSTAIKVKKASTKKEVNSFENSKHEAYMLELYPDTTDYNCNDVLKNIVEHVTSHGGIYAYVLHDKDTYKTDTFDKLGNLLGKANTLKKPHYHVVVRYSYPVVVGDLSLSYGLACKWFEVIKAKKNNNITIDPALLYLNHKNASDKYQYQVSDIKSNRLEYIQYLNDNYVDNNDKNVIALCIDYCDNHYDSLIALKEFYLFAIDNGISNYEYKDNYRVFKDIISEHNLYVRENVITSNITSSVKHQLLKDIKLSNLVNDDDMKKVINKFGTTTIEIDGVEYFVRPKDLIKKDEV